MTETQYRQQLNLILGDLADELDVPPSKYEEAKEHYDAVGTWLGEDDSELASYGPVIYPQGSFALGTAVKPIGDDDYDVDAVCSLQLDEDQVSQPLLKKMVGDRLKHPHSRYRNMLDPADGGRRCWTIKYADASKFHLDVLPAIPDEYAWLIALGVPEQLAKYTICITDRNTWDTDIDWPKSNPKGYAAWFKNQMLVRLEEGRRTVAMQKKVEVQQVPDYEVRTPLQRVVQLLKRHRDLRYNGDDDKPVSIIITTLAAQAYNNEADIVDALLNVVPGMRDAIEERDGILWVPNPVNPEENFADKWAETPRKQEIFFEWLAVVEQEHRNLLTSRGFEKVGTYLTEAYGYRDASAAMTKYASRASQPEAESNLRAGSIIQAASTPLARFDVPHREPLRWPEQPRYDVTISATASRKDKSSFQFNSDSVPLPEHWDLKFTATTTAPEPFDVYWQVVNTGEEAASHGARGLRGIIFPGTNLNRDEKTEYTGFHWIECFLVKDGVCVARSGEFVVNIE